MTTFDVNAILSSTAYDADGDKIGKVEQVFLDDNSGEPTFLTVNTGLFGTKQTFVPVQGARQDGDRVVLPYQKETVKDAPKVDADQHLSPAEEEELYRYYELNYDNGNNAGTAGRSNDRDNAALAGTAGTAGVAGVAGERTDARRDNGLVDNDRRDNDLNDRDRAGNNNSVTRHEERLNVATEEREAGRARLRKYVVNDHQSVDVAVEREEVSVERTPIRDGARNTGNIGEETVEVSLREERPVVSKETVAVEEVALNKETVRDTQHVEADLRKEQVDVETDTDRGGRADLDGRNDLNGRNDLGGRNL